MTDKSDKVKEFTYSSGDLTVSPEMKEAFDTDGCFLVKTLLSGEEVAKIISALEHNPDFLAQAFAVDDGTGTSSRLLLWNQPGHDITGMVARVEKVAKTCEELLGGEVYHYHTKLMMKSPRTGGSHIWHQDYGYWYQNGCLKPDMMTVFIALDKNVKSNGCLQVVKGTHRCGRIEHGLVYGQTQADSERVQELIKQFPHLHAEMDPGDALFFHCNLLHKSDKNLSDMRRWAFLCAYNRADNNPVYKHHHAQYTPLQMVANTAIMDCTNLTDVSGKDILGPKKEDPFLASQVKFDEK